MVTMVIVRNFENLLHENAKRWQFSSSDNLGHMSLTVNEERQQTSNHVKKKKRQPDFGHVN
jgi:hypothetical protein